MSWTVTMKTAAHCWSIITVEADDPAAAVAIARRLIGGVFVSVV